MNPGRIPAAPSPHAADRGFTLLEVLVSLGIIIGALAGIAALLPAAGVRLAEATQIDRAGTMAANARAEVLTRGLTSAPLWLQAQGVGDSTRAVVFGEGLTTNGTAVAMPGVAGTIVLAALGSRIDPITGFQLRDNVRTTLTGSTVITGTEWEPGVCYGCMLSSTAAPSGAGATVRLSTVVFRQPNAACKQISLTPVSGPVFTAGSGADAASDRRRFLQGCSSVLAFRSGQEPRWVPVASSWTAYAPGQTTGSGTGGSFVALSGTDWSGLVVSGTLQVFGFEGLLRVDERFVNLE